MKRVFYSLLFLTLTFSISHGQSLQWLSQLSNENNDYDTQSYHLSIITDKENNIYCAGVIKGDDENEDGSFFASKRTPDGEIVWENVYDYNEELEGLLSGNNLTDEIAHSISLAMFNRIQIGGEANNHSILLTINQNTGELFSASEISGGPNKIVKVASPLNSVGVPDGPTYVVGYFRDEIELKGQSNPITLNSSGGVDVFIGKWNVSYFSEVAHLSGPNDQIPFDVEIAQNKEAYLSYLTKGSVWLDQEQILATSNENQFRGFLLKIDEDLSNIYNKNIVNGEQQILLQQSTHLSGGNAGGGDEMIKFPITLDHANSNMYFIYNRKSGQNHLQKRIIGKINATTGETLSSQYVNLNNDAEPLTWQDTQHLMVEDIAVSECDSLYVIANLQLGISGSGIVADYSNVSSISYLLTYNTTNLSKTSQIGSTGSSLKISNLCIDRNRSVLFCGFYTDNSLEMGNLGLSYESSNPKAFVAKYLPCQGQISQLEMISGPGIICPDNYPVQWPISLPENTFDCRLIIEAVNPDHPDPSSIISYNSPTANSPTFTINDLNGYSHPIKLYYECSQNCCERIFDEKVLLPALSLNPVIERVDPPEELGNISVHAIAADLNTPNLVFLWLLYEGTIDSSDPNNFNIVIKGEGTDEENLIFQEFDNSNEAAEVEFMYSGLETKPYVIKLGVYYQDADNSTCGWYETRKGFFLDTSGNFRISGDRKIYRIGTPGRKKKN